MLTHTILIASFFLVGVFFLTTVSYAFMHLGEISSLNVIKQHRKCFFYYPSHLFIFNDPPFELLIFSTILGKNFAFLGFVFTIVYALFLFSLSIWQIIIILLVLLLGISLFGEFFPRLWSIRAADYALSFSMPFASFFLFLSLPFSFLFVKFAWYSARAKEKAQLGNQVEEMKETVVEVLRKKGLKGKLNRSDKKLIESVIKFKDRIVREIMVPRVDLCSLAAETPIRLAAQSFINEGYSRIPVYKGTIDNMIGVLMFKDILEIYMNSLEDRDKTSLIASPIDSIIKNVFYTPETKKASQLLQEFRAKQMHMAIVVDEYGGTEGVVTIEDILEEIVGEIADEYDTSEEANYTTESGGKSWIVDGRMTILDIEENFNIHLPQEGDYDTIGGYIFHKVGAIPQKGLKIHYQNFDLEILHSSDKSVEKVRITARKKIHED
ncbi:MAG: hemolysin family protein [Chlamydiales bacterium]